MLKHKMRKLNRDLQQQILNRDRVIKNQERLIKKLRRCLPCQKIGEIMGKAKQ